MNLMCFWGTGPMWRYNLGRTWPIFLFRMQWLIVAGELKSWRKWDTPNVELSICNIDIYLKYFGILQNLMRNYEILWKFMKVNESYDIRLYFLRKITHFCSVSFQCNALLEFHDFAPWKTKFTISSLGAIGKYFAIIKWKAIPQISQILMLNVIIDQVI